MDRVKTGAIESIRSITDSANGSEEDLRFRKHLIRKVSISQRQSTRLPLLFILHLASQMDLRVCPCASTPCLRSQDVSDRCIV